MAGAAFCVAVALLVGAFGPVHSTFIQTSGVRSFASIATAGERIISCNNCTTNLTMPFDFTFGIRTTRTIAVSSNGFLSMDPADQRPSCCLPVSIAESAVNRARIAVLQTGLNLTGGAVLSLCTSLSCVVSYENVSFVSHPGTAVSAQVELFVDGSIDFRYSNTTLNLASSVALFTSGVQDTTQATSIPIVMGPCSSTTGVCGSFPTSSSVRLSDVVEALNRSEFSRMVATLAVTAANNTATNARLVSALATLAAGINATASASRAGRQTVANEVSKATARSLNVQSGYLLFLSSLSNRAQGAEATIASAVSDEALRATQAIEQQTSRALGAETVLFNNVEAVQTTKQGVSSALRTQASASRRAGFAQTSRAISAATAIQAQVRQRTSTALGNAARLAFNLSTAERTVSLRANATSAQISATARDVWSTQAQTDTLQTQFATALTSLSETYSSLVRALPSTALDLESQSADSNIHTQTLISATIATLASRRQSSQLDMLAVFNTLSSALASEKSSQQRVTETATHRFASLAQRALSNEAAIDERIVASSANQSRLHSMAMARLYNQFESALWMETSRANVARSLLDDATQSASARFASSFNSQQSRIALLASSQLQTLGLASSQASRANSRLVDLDHQEVSRAVALAAALDEAQSATTALWSSVQSSLSQGMQAATSSIAEEFNVQRALISTTQDALWSTALSLFPALSVTLQAVVDEQASQASGRLLQQSSLAAQLAQDLLGLDNAESRVAQTRSAAAFAQHASFHALNMSLRETVSVGISNDARMGLGVAQFSVRVNAFSNQSLSSIARAANSARALEGALSSALSSMIGDQSRREAAQDAKLSLASSRAITMEQRLDTDLQAFVAESSTQLAEFSTAGQLTVIQLGARLDGRARSLALRANQVATDQQSTFAAQLSTWSSTALQTQASLLEGAINTTNEIGSGSEDQLRSESSLSRMLDMLESDTLSRSDDALHRFVNGSLASETSRKISSTQRLSQTLLDTRDELSQAASAAGSIVVVHLAQKALAADASLAEWNARVQSVDTSLAASVEAFRLLSDTRLQERGEQLSSFEISSSQALDNLTTNLAIRAEVVSQAKEALDRTLNEVSALHVMMREAALSTTAAWLRSGSEDLSATLEASLSSLVDAAARGVGQRDALQVALSDRRAAAQRDLVDAWLLAVIGSLNTTEARLAQETLRSLEQQSALSESLSAALAAHASESVSFAETLSESSNRSLEAITIEETHWEEEMQRGNARAGLIAAAATEAAQQNRREIEAEVSRSRLMQDTLSAQLRNESFSANRSIEEQSTSIDLLETQQQDVQRQFASALGEELSVSSGLVASLERDRLVRAQTEASLGLSLANETSRSMNALLRLNNISTLREMQLSSKLGNVNVTVQEALRAYSSQAELEEQALLNAIHSARLAWAQNQNATLADLVQLNDTTRARLDIWQVNASLQAQVRSQGTARLEQAALSLNASLLAEGMALSAALDELRRTALALLARLTATGLTKEAELYAQALQVLGHINASLQSQKESILAASERSMNAADALSELMANATQLFTVRTNASVASLHAVIRELEMMFSESLQLLNVQNTNNSRSSLADVEAHKRFFASSMHFLANRPQSSTAAWELGVPNRTACSTCAPVLLTACLVPTITASDAMSPSASGPYMPASLALGASLSYRIHLIRTRPEFFEVQAVSPNATLLLADGLASARFANLNASCMNVTGVARSGPASPFAGLSRRSQARRSTASPVQALQELFQAALNSSRGNATGGGGWAQADTPTAVDTAQTLVSRTSLYAQVKVLLLVWTAVLTILLVAVGIALARSTRAAAHVEPKFIFPEFATTQGEAAGEGTAGSLAPGTYSREARLSRRGRTVGYLVSPMPSHEVRKNVHNPLFATETPGDSPKQGDDSSPNTPALSLPGTHTFSPVASVVDEWMSPTADRSGDEWVTRDQGPRWQSPPAKASELVTMTDL